ncbi:hypothetical protein Acr_17g0003860 [Actinidia rufa]|uniref:Uncharacterized protein n=1 Tax=Actinidia rufa TaxID=165716 RepID=A0A7J0G1Z5_9ERIC|nr:hypothetical protein Acr_17g0003860 [Actinidia rufa]
MGNLDNGEFHTGDQDALSFFNEWVFLILTTSTLAIKMPYHLRLLPPICAVDRCSLCCLWCLTAPVAAVVDVATALRSAGWLVGCGLWMAAAAAHSRAAATPVGCRGCCCFGSLVSSPCNGCCPSGGAAGPATCAAPAVVLLALQRCCPYGGAAAPVGY